MSLPKLLFLLGAISICGAQAQTTAFTYQGRLADAGSPAAGDYDLRFTLYDAPSQGTAVSNAITNTATHVTDGLFTVTLDFGADVFNGANRWLDIGVRANGTDASFTDLLHRQALTPTPYAIRSLHASSALTALNADTAYTVISGAVGTDALMGNAVTSVKIADRTIAEADLSSTLVSNTFWRLSGNAGTSAGNDFIGTTDNQPLEFRVNVTRLLRLERTGLNTANIIGGSPGNYVAPGLDGATIAGGGVVDETLNLTNTVRADFASISGGLGNTIEVGAQSATISGGGGNSIGANAVQASIGGGTGNEIREAAEYGTIGGGWLNSIQQRASSATIGGGYLNTVLTNAGGATISGGSENVVQENAWYAIIGGGYQNTIQTNAQYSIIGGGRNNTIQVQASHATIPGGDFNSATTHAFAAGHRAQAVHQGAFVWADSTDAGFASTATNQFSVRAAGGVRFETGGVGMTLDGQPVLAGSVGPGQLSGDYPSQVSLSHPGNSFAGSGAGLTGLNANQLTGGIVPAGVLANAWKLGGNAGTTPGADFIGTTDNQPFQLKANSAIALRLEPTLDSRDAPNLIGGHSVNSVSAGVVGATISGGGTPDFQHLGLYNHPNQVTGNYGTISGGAGNISASTSTVGGGYGNSAENSTCVVGGGLANQAKGYISTIGGGQRNETVGDQSTIAGGTYNRARGVFSAIGGGLFNAVDDQASHAVISGGASNIIQTLSHYAVIGGGASNRISSESEYAAIVGGLENTATRSAFVGGGEHNQAFGPFGAIVGGVNNTIVDHAAGSSFIGGGESNSVAGGGSFIGGGLLNHIGIELGNAVIAGGTGNAVGANASAILGGTGNLIESVSSDSVIAGGYSNVIYQSSKTSVIGGGKGNSIKSYGGTIGGGQMNAIGYDSFYSTIPGGFQNEANSGSCLAAGYRAKANDWGTFIWADSTEEDFTSTRANEFAIRASGGLRLSSNRGVSLNAANTPIITRAYDVFDSTVPEKEGHGRWGLFMEPSNLVLGIPAVAGRQFQVAKYNANGSRSELVHVDQAGNMTIAGVYGSSSDRNAKENFTTVSPQEVLEKVAALPVSRWTFKQDPDAEHIGPMAQDFHAAFGLGFDDKHIATVDADGVALAAIQGLNQKTEDRSQRTDVRIQKLEAENAELKARLDQLEQFIAGQPRGAR